MRESKSIAIPLLSLGSFGGVRKLLELANGLVGYGYEVTLLYPEGRGATPFHIRPEVRRVEVPGRNRLRALLYYVPLLREYDVAILNFWPTAYLFPFARRSIYFVQDLEYRFHANPLLRFMARLTYSFPIPKVTYNPALARAVGTDLVIPAGVDKSRFYPDPDPSLRGGSGKVVMYMPRKERRKGADIFAEAVRRLKGCCEFEVWLVGGPEGLLSDLPVPVRRFRPKGDDELRRLYSTADVFVLTSRSEGLGFPVMEALACGTPAVATEVDGREVWDLPGIKVVAVAPEAVSLGTLEVLREPEKWRSKANEGRKGVPDVSDMVASFRTILTTHLSAL